MSGGIIALELAQKNLKVLILEAGQAIPASRQDYMENFYTSPSKMPESPYPPNPLNTDPSQINVGRATTNDLTNVRDPSKTYLVQDLGDGQTPFCSTYERIGGGTLWHWLGTSLRLLPGDFKTEDAVRPRPRLADPLQRHGPALRPRRKGDRRRRRCRRPDLHGRSVSARL